MLVGELFRRIGTGGKVVGVGAGRKFIDRRSHLDDLTLSIDEGDIKGGSSAVGRWSAGIDTGNGPEFMDDRPNGLAFSIG